MAKTQTASAKETRKPSPEDLAVKNDVRKDVVFYNAESSKEDIQFSYGGENFHLYPGRKANLPVSVIRHLRSLNRPIYDQRLQPNGDMTTVKVGETPKFVLSEVQNVPATAGAEPQT